MIKAAICLLRAGCREDPVTGLGTGALHSPLSQPGGGWEEADCSEGCPAGVVTGSVLLLSLQAQPAPCSRYQASYHSGLEDSALHLGKLRPLDYESLTEHAG